MTHKKATGCNNAIGTPEKITTTNEPFSENTPRLHQRHTILNDTYHINGAETATPANWSGEWRGLREHKPKSGGN